MAKIKHFFKRGSGEILGFCYILPCFVLILLIVISIAQMAVAQEQLEYAVYESARKAVVCQDYEKACSDAAVIANDLLDDEYDNIDTQVSINGGDAAAWAKGVYIEVTITCKVDTIFTPLASNRSSSIVMMIERNAQSDNSNNSN